MLFQILKLMFNHRKQCVLSLAIASAGAAIPKHFRNYHVEEKGGSLRETRKESIFEIPNLRNLVLSCYSVVVFLCVPNLGVGQLSFPSGKGLRRCQVTLWVLETTRHTRKTVYFGQLCAARVLMAYRQRFEGQVDNITVNSAGTVILQLVLSKDNQLVLRY